MAIFTDGRQSCNRQLPLPFREIPGLGVLGNVGEEEVSKHGDGESDEAICHRGLDISIRSEKGFLHRSGRAIVIPIRKTHCQPSRPAIPDMSL